MRRTLCGSLLILGSLLTATGPSRAEVVIRAPYVNLALGQPAPPGSPGICVHVPFFDLRIARGGVPVAMPPATANSAPEQLPAPKTAPAAVPAPMRAMTVTEFANSFQPAPGTYEVVLIHPRSGCAVPVCFTLPQGCCKKVCVRRHELAFDYGCQDVCIHFRICSRVKVVYH